MNIFTPIALINFEAVKGFVKEEIKEEDILVDPLCLSDASENKGNGIKVEEEIAGTDVQSTNFMEITAVNDDGSEFKIEEDFVVKEEPNCAKDDAEHDGENAGSILGI